MSTKPKAVDDKSLSLKSFRVFRRVDGNEEELCTLSADSLESARRMLVNLKAPKPEILDIYYPSPDGRHTWRASAI